MDLTSLGTQKPFYVPVDNASLLGFFLSFLKHIIRFLRIEHYYILCTFPKHRWFSQRQGMGSVARKCDSFRVITFYKEREHSVMLRRICVQLMHWSCNFMAITFQMFSCYTLLHLFLILKEKEKSTPLTFWHREVLCYMPLPKSLISMSIQQLVSIL